MENRSITIHIMTDQEKTSLDTLPSPGLTLLDVVKPKILVEQLAPKLDTNSLINFRNVNKFTFKLFQPTLLQRLKEEVAQGAKKQVAALLSLSQGFATRDLLGLCKRALLDIDIELLKVITKGRENLLNLTDIPKTLIDKNNTYDFGAVVAAIESGENVEEALAKMRTDLEKIVKEKGFPFQAMLDAYKIFDQFDDKKYYKAEDDGYDPRAQEECNLFNVKVIGYLQYLLPARLKKWVATGMIYAIKKIGEGCGEEGGDTFILSNGQSIDPALAVPNKGLGFDFYVNMFGLPRTRGGAERGAAAVWEDFFEQEQQELGKLMQGHPRAKKGGCVIV